jgi:hypothetical protein
MGGSSVFPVRWGKRFAYQEYLFICTAPLRWGIQETGETKTLGEVGSHFIHVEPSTSRKIGVGALRSVAGAMFPGLRAEISEILALDFCNLQVLHEALDQPGGLVALADYVAARLGEEQLMIARDLRQFKEHTGRDMQRERRMMCRRLVRPRLEEPTVSAEDLQETFSSLLKREAVPIRQVRKTRLSQNLTLEVGNPLQVAEEERVRWALTLSQYIIEAGLPVVSMIQETEDQRKGWCRIFGSRRAKTLRNRATTWKRYYIWLVLNRVRHWPKQLGDVTDYLEVRLET